MRETLRQSYDAFNRGDFDAAIKLVHPDIEMVPPGKQSPLRGSSALRAWMEPDAFEDQQFEVLESYFNEDRVLVLQLMRARGTGSGIEMELSIWSVWTFDEDGLWTRLEGFLPHEEAEARTAAGLTD